MAGFKDIKFGHSSAEAESSMSPELLAEGYLDPFGVIKKAEFGHEFLFLGYKGSGKTAISKKMRMNFEGSSDKFITNVELGDFPFTPFSKIIKGEAEPEAKHPVAWSWLLLIKVLQSLSQDSNVSHPRPDLLNEAIEALRSAGLIENDSLGAIIKASSKNAFSIKIPKIIEYTRESGKFAPDNSISYYVESLKKLVADCKTDSFHCIFLDGLDDIITRRSTQFEVLGGLFFEVNRINDMMRYEGVNIKINIACRSDIFEKISSPNKNKIKQDYSVSLDWYIDPSRPEHSMLIKAANLRAGLSLGREVNIFEEYIPKKYKEADASKFILEYTRHTPRDFFMFMKSLQKFYSGNGKIYAENITSAIRDYSEVYFISEIKDELDGYLESDEKERMFSAIQRVGRRNFSFDDLMVQCKDLNIDAKLAAYSLERMYDCGAISNYTINNGVNHFTSKYRNRESLFKLHHRISIHKALQRALNLT